MLVDLSCLSQPDCEAKLHVFCVCVRACVHTHVSDRACAHKLAGRPEVRPVKALLCLAVDSRCCHLYKTPCINARRDGLADQKTTNYTVSRLTLGGRGRAGERWRRPRYIPRANKQRRTRARVTEGLLGCGVSVGSLLICYRRHAEQRAGMCFTSRCQPTCPSGSSSLFWNIGLLKRSLFVRIPSRTGVQGLDSSRFQFPVEARQFNRLFLKTSETFRQTGRGKLEWNRV